MFKKNNMNENLEEEIDINIELKKGEFVVSIGLILGIVFFIATIYFTEFNDLIVIIAYIPIVYVFWLMSSILWKINAFKNVRNVHRLQKIAVRHKLIPVKNSIADKIQNIVLGSLWSDVEKKFEIADETIYLQNLPEKLIFAYDYSYLKFRANFALFICILTIVFGASLINDSDSNGYYFIAMAVILFIGSVYLRNSSKKNTNKFIVTREYLKFDDRKFMLKNIKFLKFEIDTISTKRAMHYITFSYDNEYVSSRVDRLTINVHKLEILVDKYLNSV